MWFLLLSVADASVKLRPPPLPELENCVVYDGTAAGNDPSVQLSLRICEDDKGGISGEAQWSSTRSGWNRRSITGKKTRTGYDLRDVAVVASKPAPGWRFCTIDRWDLTLSGTDLTGSYSSKACDDTATVTLSKR